MLAAHVMPNAGSKRLTAGFSDTMDRAVSVGLKEGRLRRDGSLLLAV